MSTKLLVIEQGDVVEDDIPFGKIKIRIDLDRIELQQDKDLIFISRHKLDEFIKMLTSVNWTL